MKKYLDMKQTSSLNQMYDVFMCPGHILHVNAAWMWTLVTGAN